MKTVEEYIAEHADDKPEEWMRPFFAFFATPAIFIIVSLLYMIGNKMSLVSVLMLACANVGFLMYRMLQFMNQQLLIYPYKLVYKYGLFKQHTIDLPFTPEIFDRIKACSPTNLVERIFHCGEFQILGKGKHFYSLHPINEHEQLMDVLTTKITEYYRNFDENFKPKERVQVDKYGRVLSTEEVDVE